MVVVVVARQVGKSRSPTVEKAARPAGPRRPKSASSFVATASSSSCNLVQEALVESSGPSTVRRTSRSSDEHGGSSDGLKGVSVRSKRWRGTRTQPSRLRVSLNCGGRSRSDRGWAVASCARSPGTRAGSRRFQVRCTNAPSFCSARELSRRWRIRPGEVSRALLHVVHRRIRTER